jgi:hypothetical protein
VPYAHAGSSSLHDIASGSNGSCTPSYLCTGTNGYDGPSGVGTPDGLAPSPPARRRRTSRSPPRRRARRSRRAGARATPSRSRRRTASRAASA